MQQLYFLVRAYVDCYSYKKWCFLKFVIFKKVISKIFTLGFLRFVSIHLFDI